MDEAKNFVLWFLQQLPTFFTSQPMASFVGFAFLAIVIRIFRSIMSLGGLSDYK